MAKWGRAARSAIGVVTLAALCALGALAALAANGSVTYTYDALGRVTTASYDTNVCVAYAYDPNGNRTSQSVLMTTPTSTGYWGCFTWGQAQWGNP
jgi:YD repeat-containing protein